MPRLILHIGSHKTGTTSLQAALNESRSLLADQQAGVIDQKLTRNAGLLDIEGKKANFRGNLKLVVADAFLHPLAETTVFSEEALFWLHDIEQVEALAKLLRQRFDRIDIVAYLRRQDQMVLSHRKQVVLGRPARAFYGTDFLTLPKPAEYLNRLLDFHGKLFGCWATAFGKEALTLVPYERDRLRERDVVADFAHRTGIRLQASMQDHNPPLGASEIIAGMACGDRGFPQERLRKILKAVASGAGDNRQILPTQGEARAFMEQFAASNLKLSQDFQFEGAPFTFSDRFDMYPETEVPDWTATEMLALLRHLLPQSPRGTPQGNRQGENPEMRRNAKVGAQKARQQGRNAIPKPPRSE